MRRTLATLDRKQTCATCALRRRNVTCGSLATLVMMVICAAHGMHRTLAAKALRASFAINRSMATLAMCRTMVTCATTTVRGPLRHARRCRRPIADEHGLVFSELLERALGAFVRDNGIHGRQPASLRHHDRTARSARRCARGGQFAYRVVGPRRFGRLDVARPVASTARVADASGPAAGCAAAG
jgi:hypothetical protein